MKAAPSRKVAVTILAALWGVLFYFAGTGGGWPIWLLVGILSVALWFAITNRELEQADAAQKEQTND